MRKVTIVLLVVLAMVIAACGGQDAVEAEPTLEVADVPATDVPPTEAPPTEVSPTEVPPTEEAAVEDVPESASPLETMEHDPDPDLVNITWEWDRRDPNGNEVPEIIVPNPEKYTLFFNEDGIFNATLDCNNANGSYKTPTPGDIFMELGPMTMAACEEGSLADDMANIFGPAQSYRFEEDGDVLIMVWAAGGPLDYFRNAEVVIEGEEEVEGIPEDAIEMDLQGLAESYSWQVIPASPIPQGPGGKGFPPHILLTFDGASPEDVIPSSGPYMYIFPTQAYINMYLASGNSIVADQVAKLEQLIATAEGRQDLPESPMPLLPPPNSFMDRWVQYLDLNFGVGEGVRYVSDSPFRQDKGAWTNETTGYYYQGLTTDGTFYVSLFWPVSTESLPDTSEDVSEDVQSAAQEPETSAAYQQQTKDALNALPPSGWDPDLASLDAMMESLTFPTPEAAAEEEEETPVGDDEEVDLPEPSDGAATGTVTAPDGVFVRTGPGTEYPEVGAAPFGEIGTIVGVSEDGEWWAVEAPVTPETPDGIGWVSAQYIDANNAENVPVITAAELQPSLTGKTWQWVSLADPEGMTAVPAPSSYTILFNEDGTANIKADCNQVGATYTTEGSNISITLGPSTLAACSPESLDQVFLDGLINAAIYFFEEADLYMDLNADGGTMRFSATSGTAPIPPTDTEEGDAAPLNLVSFGPIGSEQAIIPGSQITAFFSDTEVSGFAGCNDYSAALTTVDDYFTVGPIATTQKLCSEPAGIMEQESAYLAALGGTSGYQWEEQLVNDAILVTAGQVYYVLTDGTSGVLNFITTP